jgi:DNA-binding MarR family transcriptional regulator
VTELADGLSEGWVSVSELSRLRGVDKAAISRRVARLEELGALKTKPGPRGSKLISVNEFEAAIAKHGDAVNEANGRRAVIARDDAGRSPDNPNLAQEQARRTKIQADIAQLELDELRGSLVRLADFSAGVRMHGETLARVIDQLPDEVSALAVAEAKNGSVFAQTLLGAIRSDPPGSRAFFKILARNHRNALADAFAALAQAPAEEAAASPLESEMAN